MSLIQWYKLDGDQKDSSGNGNDGTQYNLTYQNGKLGQQGDFSNSYLSNVNINNNFTFLTDFSFSMWINPQGTHYHYDGAIISSGNWNVEHWSFGINQDNTAVRCRRPDFSFQYSFNLNEWYHLSFIRNGTNIKQYINGNLEFDSNIESYIPLKSDQLNTMIGRETYQSGYFSFNGLIDDVRIYDHQLSTKEIKELSKQKILHYKFDDFQEPTENLAPYTDYSNRTYGHEYNAASWGGDSGKVYYYENGGVNNLPYKKLVKTIGGTGGQYLDDNEGFMIENDKTYVISAWIKTSREIELNSHVLNINRVADNSYRVGLSDTLFKPYWKKYSWIYNSGSDHSGEYQTRHIIYIDTDLPLEVYWCGFQIEKKDHQTPFVNGTRTGKVIDSSGNNNHQDLQVQTTPTWKEDGRIGKGYYSFDGDNDYITIPNSESVQIIGDISISFWIYVKDHSVRTTLIDKAYGGEFTINLEPEGPHLRLYRGLASGNSTPYIAINSGTIGINKWIHACCIVNGIEAKWYINSINTQTASSSNFVGSTSSNNITIGKGYTSGFFDGDLDDIRIYQTQLSQDEVKELYQTRQSLDNIGNLYQDNIIENDNLAKDPSFENSIVGNTPTGWTRETGSPTIINTESHNGSQCVYFPGDGVYHRIKSDNFDVTPGEKIYGRCYVKCESGAKFYFGLLWNNGTYSYFNHPEPTEWSQTQDQYLTVPSGVTKAGIWLFNYQDNSGQIWVDDVYVRKHNPIEDGFADNSEVFRDNIDNHLNNNGTLEQITINETGPTNGLVGWWKLDGTTKDYSGNNNDGINNGAIITGGLNQSQYEFDGVDDYINIDGISTIISNRGIGSVSFWFNIPVDTGLNSFLPIYYGGRYIPIGNYSSSWQNESISINNDLISAQYTQGHDYYHDGIWHYFTLVIGSNFNYMYVDGTKLTLNYKIGNENVGNCMWGQIDTVRLGNRTTDFYGRDGKIQDVRIYNRQLSEKEVNILYKMTKESNMLMSNNGIYTKRSIIEV